MSDLISREAAINSVMGIEPLALLDYKTLQPVEAAQKTADVIKALEGLPTIAPVKHGRWIHERLCSTTGGTYPVTRCSLCQNTLPFEWTPQYCPNCGSQMDEEAPE